ncbi:MAG: hypothetical protein ACKOPD_03075, partial [Polynucleobacter victoriensis]
MEPLRSPTDLMTYKPFKILTLLAILLIAGCAFAPKPMAPEDQQELLAGDRVRAMENVEPVGQTLTMSEAVARGLK